MTRVPTPFRYVIGIVVIGVAGFSAIPTGQSAEGTTGADSREIPVPRIATAMGSLPGVHELPVRVAMPDVMTMNGGTRVTAQRQWQTRKDEMRRILSYYAVGTDAPGAGECERT